VLICSADPYNKTMDTLNEEESPQPTTMPSRKVSFPEQLPAVVTVPPNIHYRGEEVGSPKDSVLSSARSEEVVEGDDDVSHGEVDIPETDTKFKIIGYSPTKRFVCFNDRLGEGAFKKVYRAYDTTQGLEVAWNAVKVGGISASARQRVVQEMKILQTLNHPSIIHFFASFLSKETESVVFITEMMASGTLKDFIQIRPVRLRIVKRWCRHILHALMYLHSRDPPIIHRDLKCDNFFINGSTGDIRIGDLGLASWQRNGAARSVLGTPEYMAPEMFEEHYDEQVDTYAFGMCVLEMITKETPFLECTSTPQIYKKVMAGIVPDCFNRLIDSPTKKFIYSCIRMPKEGNRRPSAQELRASEFLVKRENDPEDDIDCSELLKTSSGPTKQREAKNSFTSSQEVVVIPPPCTPSSRDSVDPIVSGSKSGTIESNPAQTKQPYLDAVKTGTEVARVDVGKSLSRIHASSTENWEESAPSARLVSSPSESVRAFDSKAEDDSESINVRKGAVVRSRFGGGGDWFTGRIADVKEDGTYRIHYDDADYEDGVKASLMEIYAPNGQFYNLQMVLDTKKRQKKMPEVDSSSVASSENEENPKEYENTSEIPFHTLDRQVSDASTCSILPLKECRWCITGVGSEDKDIIKVKFTQRNSGTKTKQTAQFEFDIKNDTASQLAAELCEEMNLQTSDTDSLVITLVALRSGYTGYCASHDTYSDFKLEKSSHDEGLPCKTSDDLSPQDLEKQIFIEEEKYKKVQAEHARKLEELRKMKEAAASVGDSESEMVLLSKEEEREMAERRKQKAKEDMKLLKKKEAEEAEKKLFSADNLFGDDKSDPTTLKQKMLYGTHSKPAANLGSGKNLPEIKFGEGNPGT